MKNYDCTHWVPYFLNKVTISNFILGRYTVVFFFSFLFKLFCIVFTVSRELHALEFFPFQESIVLIDKTSILKFYVILRPNWTQVFPVLLIMFILFLFAVNLKLVKGETRHGTAVFCPCCCSMHPL